MTKKVLPTTVQRLTAKPASTESPEERAAHHPSVMFVDLEPDDAGSQMAAFSVPSGGAACIVTLEGSGKITSAPKISLEDEDAPCEALLGPNGWVVTVLVPPGSTWWRAVRLSLSPTQTNAAAGTVRVCVHRSTSRASMVDATFLPARPAEARLPERSVIRQDAFADMIDRLLDAGEIENAAKMTVGALAIGLETVKATHGARVLKAVAANADFTVSNDGLKLFIAMSS